MPSVLRRSLGKKTLPWLVLLFSSFVAVGLVATEPELEPKPIAKILPLVKVKQVNLTTEVLKIYSEGIIRPKSESSIIPEVDGRIEWVNPRFVTGEFFKQGEKLFQIDDLDFRTAVENAEARTTKAQIDLEFAQAELQRNEALRKKKLVSQSAFDDIYRRHALAQSEAKLASLELEKAKRNLLRTSVLAPFDGRVVSESVEVGKFFKRGDKVAEVYGTSVFQVRLPVAIQQMEFMQQPSADYQPRVDFSVNYAGKRHLWQGRLVRTEAELDAQSRMSYAVVEIDPAVLPENLPMGLFVQAAIHGKELEQLVRLHRGAIRNGEKVVVVDSEQRLRLRPVKVLRNEGNDVVISAGLAEGDVVCVAPVSVVVEGMEVETVYEAREEAAPLASQFLPENTAGEALL